jgi:RNA polymerase sigma factor (sigma-70 family)
VRHRLLTNVVDHIRILASAKEDAARSDQELLDRFIRHSDEAAFTALVDRHAAMVLGVCRRVLKHAQDAEDACQAVFLVLARQAGAIRKAESLGGWLQRVAYHVALRVKASTARLPISETSSAEPSSSGTDSEMTWREALSVLDEEITRLPRTYRAPIVLCYLEGRTQDEAARQLGWSLGALRGRLERGRRRLRERLLRRGIGPPAILFGAALAPGDATLAGLGLPLTELIKATRLYALARQPSTAITARVVALAEGVIRAMMLTRVKFGLMLVVLLAVLGTGAGFASRHMRALPHADVRTEAGENARAAPKEPTTTRNDVYGEPLPADALARLGTTRLRSGTFVAGLTYSPDGKVLVSHGWAGPVCCWDAESGKELARITGAPGEPIHSAALSPDGKLIATLGGNAQGMVRNVPIRLWDRVRGRQKYQLGNGPYASLRFAPDGDLLAVVRFDGGLEMWNLRTRKLLLGWKAHGHPTIIAWGADSFLAWTVSFTAGSKTLLTAHPLEGIRLWDVASGTKLRELPYRPQPEALAISEDGKLLAIGTHPEVYWGKATEESHGRIRLVDLGTGKDLKQFSAAGKSPFGAALGIRSVAFSRDAKKLAARGADGYYRVWDVASGTELHRWWSAPSMPRALAFSPDNSRLAASSSGAIRLLNLTTGKETGPPLENGSMHAPVAFSQDGRTAITLGHRTPLLWDASSGRLRHRLEGHGELTYVYGLARAGDTLFTWGDDKKLLAWDLQTAKPRSHALAALAGKAIRSAVASADGKQMAFWFHEQEALSRHVLIMDVATGKEIGRLSGPAASAFGGALHPDGKTLVTWGADGLARIWEIATGRQNQEIPFVEPNAPPGAVRPPVGVIRQGRFYSAVLSPDGRLLAFGSEQKCIAIHELATGRLVRRIDHLPDAVGRMVFSPDERTLFWAGKSDPIVRLIEVASGKERHGLIGHRGSVWSLAVSSDGRQLLSGSLDTTALVWDLARPRGGQSAPRTVREQEAAWADLASTVPDLAYQAVRRLAASPPALLGRLKPSLAVDKAQLARLLRELDSDDFTQRTKASEALEALGEGAIAACQRALAAKSSLDLHRRLSALAEKQARVWWADTPDRLREVRTIEALELSGSPQARLELAKLARGASGYRLTDEAKGALQRLAAPGAAR